MRPFFDFLSGLRFLICKSNKKWYAAVVSVLLFASCSTVEKASFHGFNSGFYELRKTDNSNQEVYLDIAAERLDVYDLSAQQSGKQLLYSIPLSATDSIVTDPLVFRKQSLDMDITTLLMKYRPSVYGMPAQLTTDLNMALYVGWRRDIYRVSSKADPLKRSNIHIRNRGYDLGVFAGPGTTLMSPFTTLNRRSDEYSGMIMQAGVAGFIESNVASFGLALGYDYLLNPDRKIWIYTNKPWLGFVVGIALN
jgi:hypothetical protein